MTVFAPSCYPIVSFQILTTIIVLDMSTYSHFQVDTLTNSLLDRLGNLGRESAEVDWGSMGFAISRLRKDSLEIVYLANL